jgi:hypothetical protein
MLDMVSTVNMQIKSIQFCNVCIVQSLTFDSYRNRFRLDFFESTRHLRSSLTSTNDDYRLERQAVARCCQHRSYCFIYGFVGLIQGRQTLNIYRSNNAHLCCCILRASLLAF